MEFQKNNTETKSPQISVLMVCSIATAHTGRAPPGYLSLSKAWMTSFLWGVGMYAPILRAAQLVSGLV